MALHGKAAAVNQIIVFVVALVKFTVGDQVLFEQLAVAHIHPGYFLELVVQVQQLRLERQPVLFHGQLGIPQIIGLLEQFRLPVHDIEEQAGVGEFQDRIALVHIAARFQEALFHPPPFNSIQVQGPDRYYGPVDGNELLELPVTDGGNGNPFA